MVTKKLHRSSSGTSVLLTKLCQLALLIMVQAEASIQHGSTECLSMGFTSQLVCSSCSKLPDYDLNVIKDNCYKCCQPETDEAATKKYSSAVLEVCSWKLGRFPQVRAFIKSDRPNAFPNLSIKYVRGKDPTVVLYDEDDQVKETLSVEKWDTDNIEEFFAEKLQ